MVTFVLEPDNALSGARVVNQLDLPSLCVQCQGGRLVGQAVHERDVGWRYYFACTDCDTKIELGQGSVRQFAQASTEAVAATANSGGPNLDASAVRPGGNLAARSMKSEDRTCSHPGSTTFLSAYNTTTACWAHTGPSFQ